MPPSSTASSPRSSRSGSGRPSKEDKETTATRKELRNASISGNTDNARRSSSPQSHPDHQSPPPYHTMSPKKKRTHDQVHGDGFPEQVEANDHSLSQEPDKKRHRDELSIVSKDGAESLSRDQRAAGAPHGTALEGKKPSAFAASGFAALASTGSPFSALGAAAKGTGFAAAQPTGSFLSAANPKPTLDFSKGTSESPFTNLTSASSNGFSGSFASPFGATTTGKLTSFAQPGGSLKTEKKQRPFGAPDSEAEEDSDSEDSDNGTPSEDEGKGAGDDKKDEAKAATDEKKKIKLQMVAVDDGEAGEATIAQARCKMYYIDNDNKEAGWKERGAGILKLNVPANCMDFDEDGAPIQGSFDASALDDESAGSKSFKGARLIMRQDQTHRLILNTVLLPAMTFNEKSSTRAVNVLFTAFEAKEGDDTPRPFSVNMKMSAANAKAFLNEVSLVQRELQAA